MTIFAMTATVVFLTCFALENQWPLRGSVAATGNGGGWRRAMMLSLRTSSSVATANDVKTRDHGTYADEPQDYDSDDGDSDDDYKDVDDIDNENGNLQQQEHEDQLDQDDPGKYIVL